MHSVVYEFLVLFYNEAVINMSDDLLYAIPKIVFRTPFLFQKYPNICSERDIIVRSFKSDFEGSAISPVFDALDRCEFQIAFSRGVAGGSNRDSPVVHFKEIRRYLRKFRGRY